MANIAHYIEICKKYSVFPAPELHWELPFPGWVWWAASPSSMGWRGGGAHHFPTFLTSPKVVFSMEAENGCLAVTLLAASQNHRVLWVRKKLKDGPVPVPHRGQGCRSMVGEIPSFKGILIKDYQYFL